jgi:hypothetical protein
MHYAVVGRLGRGGMGVVDLAAADDGSQVALKRVPLHGSAAEMEQARRRIRREAEVLRSLHHPAVVPLLDVLDDGDDVVLVMPYLPGGTLAERVATWGPMPPEHVVAIAGPLLGALAAAHRQGVVHRDVKPANVLFDERGAPLLGDFGVAVCRDLTAGLTGHGLVVGTPPFMSPEQTRGETVGPPSDVYSLGATLRFALTGTTAGGRLPRTVPPALRRLLEAMCHPDPRRRPTAAALAGGPDGTVVKTLRRPMVRRSRLVVALAVLGAVAVVAAAAALPRSSGRRTPAVAAPPPCAPLPYQPCGGPLAPFTDGRRCTLGHDDYDGSSADGCEAAPDALDGTVVHGSLRANLVPRGDVDTYRLTVADHFQLLCDGAVHVTLTAPAGVTERLEVLRDGAVVARGASADGTPASVSVGDPDCLTDDSGVLEVRVSSIGAERTAQDYLLEARGSY